MFKGMPKAGNLPCISKRHPLKTSVDQSPAGDDYAYGRLGPRVLKCMNKIKNIYIIYLSIRTKIRSKGFDQREKQGNNEQKCERTVQLYAW